MLIAANKKQQKCTKWVWPINYNACKDWQGTLCPKMLFKTECEERYIICQ